MQILPNGLSVDVEEAFHASAFEKEIDPHDWETLEQRTPANTARLLELFAAENVRGTFFVLGWVAERHPELVRQIHAAGHEIACHGYGHRLIYNLSPARFREDVSKSKKLLEDQIGEAVQGFRAPSYSIIGSSLWALDILADQGFSYDSSIFPIRHDRYGIPNAPRFPYRVRTPGGATLIELPPSSLRIARWNLPVAGGGYFRLYPLPMTMGALWWMNHVESQPGFVYVHPWEIDPDQPRLTKRPLTWWRHTVRSRFTLTRLRQLLRTFSFAPFREVIASRPHLVEERLEGVASRGGRGAR